MSKEKETGKEKGRIRQLARYYIPYKGLFFTDMFFAMLGAAITLVIPLIVRYITRAERGKVSTLTSTSKV